MKNQEILELLYIKKDYSEIKELLKNSNDFRSFYILGKINLLEGNLEKAHFFFNKAQCILGCIYCHILDDKLKEAKILINLVKDSSPAIKWLGELINIIENKECDYLSYFQIRNFYEQDLELFFKYNKKSYIDKLINNIEHLKHFNLEIYKYTGRVLLNNNILDLSESFLQKSINIFYNDPETHYLLGELYLKQGNKKKAIKEFNISNEVNTEYSPALNKLKDLSY